MPTRYSRTLIRILVAAFLLLRGSDANPRARIPVHRHRSSHPGISAANHSALLAATPVPNPKDAAAAPSPLLASAASVLDGRVPSEAPPTRDCGSACSHERTAGQAARPPPFQA